MKEIIDISDETYNLIQEKEISSPNECVEIAWESIYNGIPIAEFNIEKPTNGDIIKAMFPHYDIEIDEEKGYVRIFYEDFYTTYSLRWWNSPYKRGDTDGSKGCTTQE